MLRTWPRLKPDQAKLQAENRELQSRLTALGKELRSKRDRLRGLEAVLAQRHSTIDHLRAKLERSQQQVQKLDQECEHLAQLFR